MAVVFENDITEGLRGKLGAFLVFRKMYGKTYVSRAPRKPTTQSALQKENRSRFREASHFAKQCMLVPEKKAYYMQKAKELNLPNAYTAAITDFMRTGKITEVEVQQHASGSTREVVITTAKKDFETPDVLVEVRDEKGTVNFQRIAHRSSTNRYQCTIPAVAYLQSSIITITLINTDKTITSFSKYMSSTG